MILDILSQKDELIEVQGLEITRLVEEQHRLEKKYPINNYLIIYWLLALIKFYYFIL